MKDVFKVFIFVLFFLFSTHDIYALSVTLEEALATAASNSEQVSGANFTLERSREFTKEIRSINKPKIGAEIHYNVNDLRFYNNHGVIRNDTGFNAGASIEFSYVMTSFGYIKKSLEAAALSVEVSSADRHEVLNNLALSVKIAYFSTIAAKDIQKIIEYKATEIKRLQKLLQAEPELNKDKAFLEGISAENEVQLEQAKYLVGKTLRLLSVICASYEPITEISDSFTTLSTPNIDPRSLATHIEKSPKIVSMKKNVELELKNARKEEAANNPTLNLFGKYSFVNQSARPILTDPLWIGYGYGGIGLFIPIYDGGLAKSKGRSKRLQAYIFMSKLEQERRYLMSSLADLGEKYQTYKTSAEINNKAELAFKEAYSQYFNDYEKGKIPLTEILRILEKLTDTKIKSVNDFYSIHESLAEIEKITSVR